MKHQIRSVRRKRRSWILRGGGQRKEVKQIIVQKVLRWDKQNPTT